MKTEYYCPKCRAHFAKEEEVPNINRKHTCGHFARIKKHHERKKK